MDKVSFTRLELYNLVWKFPLIQIAKHYEISTMGIKNACDKMQIPLPNNRHWNKLEYKRSERPKLSTEYNTINQIYILKKRYEMQFRYTSKSTPLLDSVHQIKKEVSDLLIVKQKLENPSKIVYATEDYYKNLKKNDNDFLEILNLNVSNKSVNRALLFMDAFIKILEFRGHQMRKNNNGSDSILFTNGIEIEIDLREALKRITIEGKRETSEYVFTGEFILRAKRESIKKEWRDGKDLLENKLAIILAKLELIANEESFL
ncbi:hypothetical protein [Flavobacterium chungbukense]|uniref:Uncharacterized protein n=1 Tax=Flavobacterium chungbukense TaxID=877464 RepID=A0ABP7YGQ0_9FLAO|nr:hypothetical protein [Flavobacterium chungbukense]MCC4920339.1 hypothetical protein [Flavobacterium chungbukense]